MQAPAKRLKQLEMRVAHLENMLGLADDETPPPRYEVGQVVKARILDELLLGVVAFYVSECKGYSVYIPSKVQHVFLAEETLFKVREPPTGLALPDYSEARALKFATDANVIVEVHHSFRNGAHSYQYGKVLQVYPQTREYLVRFIDFDETNWDEGYEVVAESRLAQIPARALAKKSVPENGMVLASSKENWGFWAARVVERVKDKVVIQYLNKNWGALPIEVTKEKLYRYPTVEIEINID